MTTLELLIFGFIVGGWNESHNDDLYLGLLFCWLIVSIVHNTASLLFYLYKRRKEHAATTD
jgi:hypothetical protein